MFLICVYVRVCVCVCVCVRVCVFVCINIYKKQKEKKSTTRKMARGHGNTTVGRGLVPGTGARGMRLS
jgi:hypothetical protein